jgi:hypothetical protein
LELIPYEPVSTVVGKGSSVPNAVAGRHWEIPSWGFFLFLHAIFIGIVLLYQSLWLFSEKTTALCETYWGPYGERRNITPGTIIYRYKAGDEIYEGSSTRNGISITQKTLPVRYLRFKPSISRPDTYEGNWLAFHIAWLIFFVITAMIFFIPNDTIPRNSYIYFTKRKPWINMIVR